MLNKFHELRSEWVAYKQRVKAKSVWKYEGLDLLETLVWALIIALVMRQYVIQVSVVPTGSMIPTMQIQDRLLVNRFVYHFEAPERGDIVVFKSPHGDGQDYVKRLVGMPGDVVSMDAGVLYVNGEMIAFPGVSIKRDYVDFPEFSVPEEEYFMVGDNRPQSSDSRYWGTVPRRDIKGQAWFVFWPFSRMQVLY